jgi:hypothetical protein
MAKGKTFLIGDAQNQANILYRTFSQKPQGVNNLYAVEVAGSLPTEAGRKQEGISILATQAPILSVSPIYAIANTSLVMKRHHA